VGALLLYMPQHLLTYICRWSPLPREELYDTYLSGVYKTEYIFWRVCFYQYQFTSHNQYQRSYILACDITPVCDICTRCTIRPSTTPVFDRITRILPLVACVSYQRCRAHFQNDIHCCSNSGMCHHNVNFVVSIQSICRCILLNISN